MKWWIGCKIFHIKGICKYHSDKDDNVLPFIFTKLSCNKWKDYNELINTIKWTRTLYHTVMAKQILHFTLCDARRYSYMIKKTTCVITHQKNMGPWFFLLCLYLYNTRRKFHDFPIPVILVHYIQSLKFQIWNSITFHYIFSHHHLPCKNESQSYKADKYL